MGHPGETFHIPEMRLQAESRFHRLQRVFLPKAGDGPWGMTSCDSLESDVTRKKLVYLGCQRLNVTFQ